MHEEHSCCVRHPNPFTIMYLRLTLVDSTSGVAGATGFATGTGASGPFATGAGGSGSGSASGSGSGSGLASGSPITPVSPSKTGTGPRFTGAATRNIGSVAVGLLAVAGIAMAL